jgi:hypothetical protein
VRTSLGTRRGGSSAGQSSGLIIRQVVGSTPTRPTGLPAQTVHIKIILLGIVHGFVEGSTCLPGQ